MGKFTDRLMRERTNRVFLVRGTDKRDRPAWYYVLVDQWKLVAFKSREGTPDLILTDYGTIIASGFGTDPPPAVARRMLDEYGFREG